MGLIKTAIMTGGGIYAIQKLSKAHQNSNNNQQSQSQSRSPSQYDQQQYNQPPPPQGYWGPPAPGKEHLGPVWHVYPPPPSSSSSPPTYENDNQRGTGGGDLPAYVYGGKN